eukprot:2307818-Pyramimonas_sp.AAC.1
MPKPRATSRAKRIADNGSRERPRVEKGGEGLQPQGGASGAPKSSSGEKRSSPVDHTKKRARLMINLRL